MKVVKISHNEYGEGCKYLFATRKSLKNGDIVLVETKNGNAVGWCVGDSKEIKKEDLEFLENACPYKLPLKEVIGVMDVADMGACAIGARTTVMADRVYVH